jgi:hypothetical protein
MSAPVYLGIFPALAFIAYDGNESRVREANPAWAKLNRPRSPPPWTREGWADVERAFFALWRAFEAGRVKFSRRGEPVDPGPYSIAPEFLRAAEAMAGAGRPEWIIDRLLAADAQGLIVSGADLEREFDPPSTPEPEPAIEPEPEPAIEPEPEPEPVIEPEPDRTEPGGATLLALCINILRAEFPEGRPGALTVDELLMKVAGVLKDSGTRRGVSKSTVERAIARAWG